MGRKNSRRGTKQQDELEKQLYAMSAIEFVGLGINPLPMAPVINSEDEKEAERKLRE